MFSEVFESQYVLKFSSHISTFVYNMLLLNVQRKKLIELQVVKVRLNDVYIVLQLQISNVSVSQVTWVGWLRPICNGVWAMTYDCKSYMKSMSVYLLWYMSC